MTGSLDFIRVVTTNEGMEKAQQHNVMFIETSSRTRQGITTLFDNLIRAIIGDDENDGPGQAHPSGAPEQRRVELTQKQGPQAAGCAETSWTHPPNPTKASAAASRVKYYSSLGDL